MSRDDPALRHTALVMRVLGWGFFPLLLIFGVLYPHGFWWGIHEGTQYHPYLFMMLALYLAWCILLIREAKNPADAGLLFDWGILANALHALVMIVQASMLDHEMEHLWADIPALVVVVIVLWQYHPRRAPR